MRKKNNSSEDVTVHDQEQIKATMKIKKLNQDLNFRPSMIVPMTMVSSRFRKLSNVEEPIKQKPDVIKKYSVNKGF